MEYQFRSSLNGFNRNDVVVYLQNLTEAHKSALLSAQTEASQATEEAARLRNENRLLHMQVADLLAQQKTAEPEAPAEPEPSLEREELAAYRRAEAAERSAAAKAAAIEQEAAARAAALEQAAEEKAAALEQAAEEKAAALEQEAAAKIEQTQRSLNEILTAASTRVNGDGSDLSGRIASVSENLAQIQATLNAMTAFLSDTAASLDALQK